MYEERDCRGRSKREIKGDALCRPCGRMNESAEETCGAIAVISDVRRNTKGCQRFDRRETPTRSRSRGRIDEFPVSWRDEWKNLKKSTRTGK